MNRKFLIMIFSLILLLGIISAARLPSVGGDTDTWGTILNEYLGKIAGQNATELNQTMVNGTNIYSDSINNSHIVDGTITDTDISDSTNLTLGEKITFTLGGIIDNIINGLITITGNLNVTNNITANYFLGDGSQLSNLPDGGNASWNETYADTLYIEQANEANLNVNDSDSVDGYNAGYFMPLNDSVSGSFDFNGGWLSDGLSIIAGNIYAQAGYFYNISSLSVTNLAINGSLMPYIGFSDTFDLGNATQRWKDLFLGGDANITGNVTASHFIGDGSELTGINLNTTIVSGNISEYDTGWLYKTSVWTNVHLGSDNSSTTSNLTHNLNAPLSELDVKVLISTDGTDENSFEIGTYGYSSSSTLKYGWTVYAIDSDNLKIQTGLQGLFYSDDDGENAAVADQDWYYKIIVRKTNEVSINSLNFSGNITASYLKGDGSELTGITGGIWDNVSDVATFDGGANVTGNITIGDKITFALGEIIDNIVDGWITITGSLNVTGNISLPEGNIFTNSTSLFYNNGSQDFDLTKGSGSVPENTIAAFNQESCPTGWILADGTSGTPDLRGIFVRGAGTNNQSFPSNSTYNYTATYGEYQNDSMQSHKHQLYRSGGYTSGTNYLIPDVDSGTLGYSGTTPIADGQNGTPRTSYETAPASYALIYCQKTAEDSAASNSIWQTIGNIVSLVNSSRILEVENLNVTGNITGHFKKYDTGWISRSDWTNVHLGTDDTKNTDSNVTHNLDAPLSDLLVKVLVSTDGTDANAHEVGYDTLQNTAGNSFGITVFGVDDNNIKVQTSTLGFTTINDAGGIQSTDTEDWYYKIKVFKLG